MQRRIPKDDARFILNAPSNQHLYDVPTIRHLLLDRFRGIQHFSWHPGKGVNLILGGGDVGKTTILEAIALVLTPVNAASISDAEYFARDVDKGSAITAVMSLPSGNVIDDQVSPAWP